MASFVFNSYWSDLHNAKVNITENTFYAMLTTTAYTPSKSGHSKRSNVSNEITGTGYVAGGVQVAAPTIAINSSTNIVSLSLPSATWTNATLTAGKCVYYVKYGGSASADILIAVIDFGTTGLSVTNSSLYIAASSITINNSVTA